MAERLSQSRQRLGARLRELRARRFRSGQALGEHLGWAQSRISKLETGRQLPSTGDIAAWVEATGGGQEFVDELTALLADARLGYRSWSWTSITATQDAIVAEDDEADLICEYQPAMLPGLVRTPAYDTALLSVPGGPKLLGADDARIDELVHARARRQQILYTPGKRVRILLGEAALWTRFSNRDIHVAALDRLIGLSELSTVELAVLPFDARCPLLPLAGFSILDDATVWLETLTVEPTLEAPDEVGAYVAAFAAAWTTAAPDERARELVRRAIEQIRGER